MSETKATPQKALSALIAAVSQDVQIGCASYMLTKAYTNYEHVLAASYLKKPIAEEEIVKQTDAARLNPVNAMAFTLGVRYAEQHHKIG
jgi:hypothetical protein